MLTGTDVVFELSVDPARNDLARTLGRMQLRCRDASKIMACGMAYSLLSLTMFSILTTQELCTDSDWLLRSACCCWRLSFCMSA